MVGNKVQQPKFDTGNANKGFEQVKFTRYSPDEATRWSHRDDGGKDLMPLTQRVVGLIKEKKSTVKLIITILILRCDQYGKLLNCIQPWICYHNFQ